MLRKKGVPNKYEEKEIVVIDNEGNEILARTYIVTDLREKFVAPNIEYLSICERVSKPELKRIP